MSVKKITAKELHKRLQARENVMILDVRANEKYNEFHIEDTHVESRNIPKTEIFQLEENKDKQLTLPKDREVIVTCTTGNSAAKCANILDQKNYQVTLLEGGVTAWKDFLKSLED
ncbi:rhodanese-like domain-containing protein [Neobacillus citreus]|uniref:Rhodanese-like domain-containing protein n=1 Tax=Neobacillus citreus TaxID=2833578 RepID=A0A942T594_9BACI|nr:rhodanese-like domain-containing protein [Neobacillus citreus]MCH6265540.1 rhodanese-like domain-containing protein [Neobacillus citreus]